MNPPMGSYAPQSDCSHSEAMEDANRRNGRGRPQGDASEFGTVRVISKPAPRRRGQAAPSLHPAAQAAGRRRCRPGLRRSRARTTGTTTTTRRRKPDAVRVTPNRNQLSPRRSALSQNAPYQAVFGDVSKIIDAARESAARSVNAAMTAAYWLIGRRIVESEQSGEERAEYGAALIERLAEDLTRRFGRGFSRQNLQNMRLFYLAHPPDRIRQTLSANRIDLLKCRFARRRLAYLNLSPSRWASTTF